MAESRRSDHLSCRRQEEGSVSFLFGSVSFLFDRQVGRTAVRQPSGRWVAAPVFASESQCEGTVSSVLGGKHCHVDVNSSAYDNRTLAECTRGAGLVISTCQTNNSREAAQWRDRECVRCSVSGRDRLGCRGENN